MGVNNSWRQPVTMNDWMRDIEKRLMHEERRAQNPMPSDVVGPGIGTYSRKVEDWDSDGPIVDGFFYSDASKVVNSPDDSKNWMGIVQANAIGQGLQRVWEYIDSPTSPSPDPALYTRAFVTNSDGTRNYSPWLQGGGGGGGGFDGVIIQDEGSTIATVPQLDFIGAGVTAVAGTGEVQLTIDGTPHGAAGGDLTGTYPNPDIRAGAVGNAELASNAVTSDKIQDGAVGNIDLADNAVTSAKIQDGTIVAGDLAPGTIPTGLPPTGPAGGSLTGTYPNPTLAANSVGASQITDGTVGNAELAANAVTTDKITDGTVAVADLNLSSVRLDTVGAPTGPVSFNSQRQTNVATPVNPTDGVNKAYVDAIAQGLDPKPSVRVATTVNLPGTNFTQIDGITLADQDRILVKNQTNPAENGIYLYSFSATNLGVRVQDLDSWAEVPGAFTFVEEGTQHDTGWVSTADRGGTLNTTAMPWTQFSGPGTITGGNGLTLTGNDLSVNVDGVGIEIVSDALRLKDGGVTSAKIADGTIVAADLAPGTLPTSLPPSGPAGGSLTGTYPNPALANNSVNSAQIADGQVGNAELAANAVTTDKIQDGTIVAADLSSALAASIAASAVDVQDEGVTIVTDAGLINFTGAGVSSVAGGGGAIVVVDGMPRGTAGGSLAGSYPNPTLAPNSVGSSQITDGSIAAGDLAPGVATPTARNLVAGAGLVGGGDLSADRTFDVNPDNVTVEVVGDQVRVKDGGITSAKIADGTIAAADLSTALDGNLVHRTGNETISGIKTFGDPVGYSEAVPSPPAPTAGVRTYSRAGRMYVMGPDGIERQLAYTAASVSLHQNPDFEVTTMSTGGNFTVGSVPSREVPVQWTDTWGHSVNIPPFRTSTDTYNGLGKSQEVILSPGTDSSQQSSVFGVVPGATINVGVFVKTTATDLAFEIGLQSAPTGAVDFFQPDLIGQSSPVAVTATYTEYHASFTVPPGHNFARVWLHSTSTAGGSVFLDNSSAEMTIPASPPVQWIKQEVKVVSTTNITLSGTQTIDGVAVAVGERVLVTGQTAGANNGIYLVQSGAWVRAGDADASSEIAGAMVAVQQGTRWGGSRWGTSFKSTDTIGTTVQNWTPGSGLNWLSRYYVGAMNSGTSLPNGVANNYLAVVNFSAQIPTGATLVNVKSVLNAKSTANQAIDYTLQGSLDGTNWTDLDATYHHNQGDAAGALGTTVEGWLLLPAASQLHFRVRANVGGGGQPVVIGASNMEANFFGRSSGDFPAAGVDTLEWRGTTISALTNIATGAGTLIPFITDLGGSGINMDGAGRLVVTKPGTYSVSLSATMYMSGGSGNIWTICSIIQRRSGTEITRRDTVFTNNGLGSFADGSNEGLFNAQAGDTFEVICVAQTASTLQMEAGRSHFIAFRLAGPGPKGDKGDTGDTGPGVLTVRAIATTTISGTGLQTIDGVSLVAGNRVLVANQGGVNTPHKDNGVYVVAAGTWAREATLDTAGELASAEVGVTEGTLYGGTRWSNTLKATDTLGTTTHRWYTTAGDSGWIRVTYASVNWRDYDLGTTWTQGQYRRLNGIVYLQGLILRLNSNSTAGENIFFLPVGFRPARSIIASGVYGAAPGPEAALRMNINPDGGVQHQNVIVNGQFVSVSNVSFPADIT